MTATITDEFKRDLIDYVQSDFLDSANSYYIGIGRVQPWDGNDSDVAPPQAFPSKYEAMSFLENVQSMKRVEDAKRVTSRYNWSNGAIYDAWNDRYHSNIEFSSFNPDNEFTDPFYVITSSNQVYVCIKQGKTTSGLPANSTEQPTNNSGDVFQTTDGYQWKYLYTVGTNDTQRFLTSGYLPANRVLDSSEGGSSYDDLDPFQQEQLTLQLRAVPGEIVGVEIVNSGSGYPDGWHEISFTGTPIVMDGVEQVIAPASAWARVHTGAVVEVTMRSPTAPNDYYFGENYFSATAFFAASPAGLGCILRPIVAHQVGMGSDPAKDLNSTAIMFNVILTGSENDTFIVDNDFRQIGLIRNPLVEDSDGAGNISISVLSSANQLALDALIINPSSLNLDNITGDPLVTQSTTGAAGILNSLQDDVLYYTQNQSTGYTPFVSGEPIEIAEGGGTAAVNGLLPSPVKKTSGDVFYIDNREPFIRNIEQTEDIKIVIDF